MNIVDDIDAAARRSAGSGPCPLEYIRRTLETTIRNEAAMVARNLAKLAELGQQPGPRSPQAETARLVEQKMYAAIPAHPERHDPEQCAALTAGVIRTYLHVVRSHRGEWAFHAANRFLIMAVDCLDFGRADLADRRAARLLDADSL
ncbi:hypothetical protein E1091_03440 [Micromonospora fluostatini]|uniref:Uncharacterized protein n=2 Tax=Micromonospora TaxID=1873 RepID=A0ABY2DLD6_9ACTN|nr:hypothetical protein E1091_03440 [Micromonospora fluostatini]